MRTNRRRHENIIPVASFVTWVIIAAFAGGIGIYCVWCRHEVHKLGGTVRNLEKRLVELQTQNESARTRLAKLAGYDVLAGKVKAQVIKLDHIQQWERLSPLRDEDTLRPVNTSSRSSRQ